MAVALCEGAVKSSGEEGRLMCEECAVHIEGGVLWAYGDAGHADETLKFRAEAEGLAFSCAEGVASWSMVAHCANAGFSMLSVDCYCCWIC